MQSLFNAVAEAFDAGCKGVRMNSERRGETFSATLYAEFTGDVKPDLPAKWRESDRESRGGMTVMTYSRFVVNAPDKGIAGLHKRGKGA